MANRRAPQGNRRMDFGRNDRGPKNFGRNGVSPWQSGGPGGGGTPNLLPLGGGSTEATLALASNLINLLQPRPNPVPSLLDMPIRRDFGHNLGHNLGRYDRGFGPNRMGNQGNFRRTGNYNRAGDRINTNRKPFKPYDGQRPQNKSSPKKDADSKAKSVKESEDEKPEGEGETEDKKEIPKTRYDDINPQLLKCHICNKSMWDGRSFENHLSGRAHAIMMQKTAESYALTADTMRQEFKIREMKRTRKSGQQPPRDFYCAMCDLYAANGPIHRTTVGHRKLKKYLHPTCTSCHKEMPTRIELDEHRLTSEHLKTMQDKSEVISKPKPEVMVISTLNMEQSYVRDDRQRWRTDRDKRATNKPSQDDQDQDNEKQGEQEESGEKADDGEATAEDKPEGSEDAKKSVDNENTILDFKEGDDLSNITTDMMPVYSTTRGVGRSFLSEFRCVQCTLCHKLLADEETAEVHLRTWRHHQLFNRLLHDKSGHQLPDNGKRAHSSGEAEDEGECKRRKTDPEDGQEIEEDELSADQNGHQDDADDKDEGNCTKTSPADEQDNEEDDLLADENGHEDDADDKEQNKDADGDVEMKDEKEVMPAEEELEDWEQSVDEILKDEQVDKIDEDKILMEEEAEKEVQEEEKVEVQEKPVTPSPPPAKPAQATPKPATPRATPRGRGRGRRRY